MRFGRALIKSKALEQANRGRRCNGKIKINKSLLTVVLHE